MNLFAQYSSYLEVCESLPAVIASSAAPQYQHTTTKKGGESNSSFSFSIAADAVFIHAAFALCRVL